MKIAIFGNTYAEQDRSAYLDFLNILAEYDCRISMEHDYYQFLQEAQGIDLSEIEVISKNGDVNADYIFSIGGDGTLLRVVERTAEYNIPVLGINVGRLGFLADCPIDEIREMMEAINSGDIEIDERSLIHLTSTSEFDSNPYALNEIAILKQDNSSMITIHCWIDGEYVNAYQADGLIIATPTGSTAYSLSVGGPIMIPDSNSLIIAPVASHSLSVRPLVISFESKIVLKIQGRCRHYLAAIDGRSEVFDLTTELMIKKSGRKALLLKKKGYSFYNTLRNKLMWGADIRITPPQGYHL